VIAYSDEFDTYPDLQVGDTESMELSEDIIMKVNSAIRCINNQNKIIKKDNDKIKEI
jgi:hypothetical protein